MAYKKTIPQSTDQLSVSQGDLLANFDALSTVMALDHYTYEDLTGNQGKHKQARFPVAVAPAPVPATEVGLFCAANADSGDNELYINKSSWQIPATASDYGTPDGFTYLPSGIILQWGKVTVAAGAAGSTHVFALQFPNVCLSVTLTPTNATAGKKNIVTVKTISDLNFTAKSDSTTGGGEVSDAYYLALGY